MAESEPERKIPENEPGWRWMMPPATFCDYFTLEAYGNPAVVRLVFGESLDKNTHPIFRTAVVMRLKDAKELVEVLSETIEEKEKALKKKSESVEEDTEE